ncbi:MAG: hypothetical protein ACI8W8_004423, partial [Rhodothermales bacterium]
MRFAHFFVSVSVLLALPVCQAEDSAFRLPAELDSLMESHCYSCHDDDTQKGDIRLDHLTEQTRSKRLDLLNRMQEQVFFKHMPPKKKKQPSEAEREAILAAISGKLHEHKASTLEGKLQKPEFGNYVDHDKLFSGDYADTPGFTYDRRWLISEYIFSDRFNRMLRSEGSAKHKGKKVPVLGSKRIHRGFTPTNPFLLPTRSGVRYYANVDLTGGHLSTMLTNAQQSAELITSYLVPRWKSSKTNKYLPAIAEIMALEDTHNAILEARRTFLHDHIETVCAEIYGEKNDGLLPSFVPVVLQPLKELVEGEVYKKAPMNVSTGMLKKLGADRLVYQTLVDPDYQHLSDGEFREFCERIWFYRGDHERSIQGRMALLREYVPEFRELAPKSTKKMKISAYKPLADDEMAVIRETILRLRKQDDRYLPLIDACTAHWEADFRQARIEAGPPSGELLGQLVDQLFLQILERPPESDETAEYLVLSQSYVAKLGNLKAIQKLIQTLMLSSEFV